MSFGASLQAAFAHPEAGRWLRQGQHLESRGDPASLEEAVRAYDHAIALFRGTDPRMRRGKAIAWMNRANALQRVETPHAAADSVRSYDQAILVLDAELGDFDGDATTPAAGPGVAPLRFENGLVSGTRHSDSALGRYEGARPHLDRLAYRDPLFLNSLGAAWMNRGFSLQQTRTEANLDAAVQSHEHAIALLRRLPMGQDVAFRRNLAAAWLNLADALLDTVSPSRHESAAAAARHAVSNADATSAQEFSFVEIDLKARRALVVALGERLFAMQTVRNDAAAALASEVSDTIDDGLGLARQWASRGGALLLELRLRLFCLGCQYYRMYQPHFLGEFVQEILGSEPALLAMAEFRSVSQHALSAAEEGLSRSRHWQANDPEAAKRLETVQALRATARWLEATPVASPPGAS